jgi:hypothetical protein
MSTLEEDFDFKEILPHNEIFCELLDRWKQDGGTTKGLTETIGISRQRVCDYKNRHRPVPMWVWVRMLRELECEVVFRATGLSVRRTKNKSGKTEYNVDISDLKDLL